MTISKAIKAAFVLLVILLLALVARFGWDNVSRHSITVWRQIRGTIGTDAPPKVSIDFYGSVYDNVGVPVRDALVSFSWDGSHSLQAFSGSDGSFSLTGVRGRYLIVKVTKDGYAPAPENVVGPYEYARPPGMYKHVPAKSRPVRFVLNRRVEKAHAISAAESYRIPPDGLFKTIRIPKEIRERLKLNESDNILLRFEQSTNGALWELSGSGMMFRARVVDAARYAPTDGYSEKWSMPVAADRSGKILSSRVQLFVHFPAQSVFGLLEMILSPPTATTPEAHCATEWLVNTSGRDLAK